MPAWAREFLVALDAANIQLTTRKVALVIDLDPALVYSPPDSPAVEPLRWGEKRTVALGVPIGENEMAFGTDPPDGSWRWRLLSHADCAGHMAGLDAFVRTYIGVGPYVPPAQPPKPEPTPEELRRQELRKMAAEALHDPTKLLDLIDRMTTGAK